MNEIYAYNEYLRQEYERTHDISVLEKYIVSETVCPIGDYENAKKLIRAHYREQTNSTLLIIGAHLAQYWGADHNDFLDILNAMYDYLPAEEQAIISYLRAEEMLRDYDFDYKNSAAYKQHLIDSVSKSDFPFVYNRENWRRYLPQSRQRHCFGKRLPIRMCPLRLKNILRMRTSVNRKHLLMNSFWEHRCHTTD